MQDYSLKFAAVIQWKEEKGKYGFSNSTTVHHVSGELKNINNHPRKESKAKGRTQKDPSERSKNF